MINYNSKISISDKELPRDSQEDVRFESFEQLNGFFSKEEITIMVTRHINNSEASKRSNAKRLKEEAILKAAVNKVAQEKFAKKYFDLQPNQQAEVLGALKNAQS